MRHCLLNAVRSTVRYYVHSAISVVVSLPAVPAERPHQRTGDAVVSPVLGTVGHLVQAVDLLLNLLSRFSLDSVLSSVVAHVSVTGIPCVIGILSAPPERLLPHDVVGIAVCGDVRCCYTAGCGTRVVRYALCLLEDFPETLSSLPDSS